MTVKVEVFAISEDNEEFCLGEDHADVWLQVTGRTEWSLAKWEAFAKVFDVELDVVLYEDI